MKAVVVVRGEGDHLEPWPYGPGPEPNGAEAVVSLQVQDSQEFVDVLRTLMGRGLEVTRAELSG